MIQLNKSSHHSPPISAISTPHTPSTISNPPTPDLRFNDESNSNLTMATLVINDISSNVSDVSQHQKAPIRQIIHQKQQNQHHNQSTNNIHQHQQHHQQHSTDSKYSAKLSTILLTSTWIFVSIFSIFLISHSLRFHNIDEASLTLFFFGSSVILGLLFTILMPRKHNDDQSSSSWCSPTLPYPTKEQIKLVIPLSVAYLTKEMLKFSALARVSVNLVNTMRSLGPLFLVILEFVFFRHSPPKAVFMSLFWVVLGVILTSWDEVSGAKSLGSGQYVAALLGTLAAAISTLINIGQNMYSKILFGREKMDPVYLQIYLSALSFLILLPLKLIHSLPDLYHKGFNFSINTELIFSVSLAAVFNFLSSQLAFSTLSKITPLTYSVLNTLKRVLIAAVAFILWKERMTPINAMGVSITIAAMALYERAIRNYKQAKAYDHANQDSSISSAISKNNLLPITTNNFKEYPEVSPSVHVNMSTNSTTN